MGKRLKIVMTKHPVREGWLDYAKLKPPSKHAKLVNVVQKKHWVYAYWKDRP